MTDIVRLQFEEALSAALLSEGYSTDSIVCMFERGSDGEYRSTRVRGAYWGWRARLQKIAVKLPALREDSDADDIAGVGLVIPMFDRGYDEALEEARVAIESVGIRVEFEE